MTFLKSPNSLTHPLNEYGVSFLVAKWPGHGVKHHPSLASRLN